MSRQYVRLKVAKLSRLEARSFGVLRLATPDVDPTVLGSPGGTDMNVRNEKIKSLSET
jgi:hypothetical protein